MSLRFPDISAADLFRAVRDRDEPALADVVRRLSPWLAAEARRAGARGGEVDEVVQDTWVAVVAAVDEFRAAHPLRPWLGAVARHRLVSLRRSQRRRARLHDLSGDAQDLVLDGAGTDVVALVRGREVLLAVHRAIADQPAPYREVLRLHLLEGLPAGAIAQRLRLGRVIVRVRLYRGLRALRRALPDALALMLLAALTRRSVGQAPLWVGVAAVGATLAVAWPLVAATDAAAAPATAPAVVAVAAPVGSEALAAAERRAVPAALAPADAAAVVAIRVVDQRGAGLAGVGVSLQPLRGGDPLLEERFASTDARGLATFAGVAPVPLRVRCDRGPTRDLAAEDRAAELRVVGGRDVRGLVVDAAGRPVAGASIWLAGANAARAGSDVARSGADGTFALAAVAEGSRLAVRADGFASTPMRAVSDGDLGTIVLARRGGAVAIEVVGPDGAPCRDAAIVLGHAEAGNLPADEWLALAPPLRGRSDDAGCWRAGGLVPGWLPLLVRAPGCAPAGRVVAVAGDDETRVRVVLQTGSSLTGRVVDAGGVGVGDVHVACRTDATFAAVDARTAADGSFRFAALPCGEVGLLAWSRDGDVRELVVTLTGAGDDVQIALPGTPRRRGRIVTTGGVALAGWQVALPRAAARSSEDATIDATADASGAFELPCGLATDWSALLLRPPTSPTWAPAAAFCRVSPDGETVLRVPPSLCDAGTLLGRITDAAGRPYANAPLALAGPGGAWIALGSTDATGRFAQPNLPIGSYSLAVESPDPAQPGFELPEVGIDAGATAVVEFAAPAAAWLDYSLEFAAGGEPHAPVVTIRSAADERRCATLHAASGQQALLPGDYLVQAIGDDFVWQTVPVHIVAGTTTALRSTLLPAVRRQFRLRHLPVGPDDGVLSGRFFVPASGETLYRFALPLDKAFPLPLTSFLPLGTVGCEATTTSGKRLRAQIDVVDGAPTLAAEAIPFVLVP